MLRLEVNPATGSVTGILKTPVYLRLIGQCSAGDVAKNGKPALATHGTAADADAASPRLATFSSFRWLALRDDRVELGSAATKLTASATTMAAAAAATTDEATADDSSAKA